MDTQPVKAATRLYFTTAATTALTAAAFIIDVTYIRPSQLSSKQIWFGLLLGVAALYTHVSLRADYIYYRRMAKHGCAPPKRIPDDPTGIRWILSIATAIKQNSLLERISQLLLEMGHTFQHRIFPEWNISISTDEPENLKTVLATRFDDWDIPRHRVRGFHPVLGYHSIFTVNGPEWQHARATLRPAFVRNQLADLERFDLHARKLLAKLPSRNDAQAVVDLQDLFSRLMVDTTSDFMFGQSTDLLGSADADSLTFVKYFDASMHKIARRARLGWLTQLQGDKELDEQGQGAAGAAAEEKKDQKEENRYVFLDRLIDTGEPDDVVRDQVLSIFVAGRDTTTSALTSLFLELSQRPDVVHKLRDEIGALGIEDPSSASQPPVALNSREAIRDTVLPRGGGPSGEEPVFVPRGTIVRYQPWCMQRRKDLYGADAEEFRPERWETIRPTYEYIPFNAGPRICIGQQFALTAIAMTTFRILQAYQHIERRDDRPPVRKLGINLSMLHGCWVSMTPA
ncbi:cytochrome p450 domain-containing protein [Apiospora kogelbergensis]|uniref:Cytochrome p450 domain-containing protein n=1 Tax=Apiospora kogelbergensis TaxID=1337665 RepID=A0AAW0QY26_9PEZI